MARIQSQGSRNACGHHDVPGAWACHARSV